MLEHYGVATHHKVRQMVKCPLHEDQTPSMSIHTDDGLWKCHSCGEAGDSYTLIEKMEGKNFVGARAFAATLGFPTGSAGGGSSGLPQGRYARSTSNAGGKGNRAGSGGYVPSWRRR